MKKYYLSILTVAACLALPMTTIAGTIGAATSLGNVAFAPSKSVTISAASATGVAWSAAALHAQGTEQYGMLSSDTKIYYKVVAAGTAIENPANETTLAGGMTLVK